MVKTSLVLAGAAFVFLLPASSQCSTPFSENFSELTPSLTATSVGGFSAINGTSNAAGNMGAHDVVLTSNDSPAGAGSTSAMVPEPEGWGLMLLALAVVGAGRLLQKKLFSRRR
ncbi:MAG TPA: hypothetical protein VF283_00460 [Bryobacteraceae bacterium]